jgi:hypothetical protein
LVAIRGHFDGKVFVPDEPVNVPADRPLILHVEVAVAQEGEATQTPDLFATLDRHAGSVEAPDDWSAQHDHYLYGTPKRDNGDVE